MSARAPFHKRLGDWWFAALPAERIAAVRILVGAFAMWYLSGRYGYLLSVNRLAVENWKPVGPIGWVLDKPLAHETWNGFVIATQIFAIAFAFGILYRVTAPIFAVLLLFTLSYRNSWGAVLHTENLLVLHVAALALAPAADIWSVDRVWKAWRGAPRPEPDGRYAWGVRLAAVLTVTTYVLAGIAKLRLGGLAWLDGDQLRNQIAYDNIRKALLGDHVASLSLHVIEHPSLFIGLAVLTMVVELGAPIALIGGKVTALWALTAWGFHVGVVALMAIVFPYPLSGVAYAPLFPLERPGRWIAGRLDRLWRWARDSFRGRGGRRGGSGSGGGRRIE